MHCWFTDYQISRYEYHFVDTFCSLDMSSVDTSDLTVDSVCQFTNPANMIDIFLWFWVSCRFSYQAVSYLESEGKIFFHFSVFTFVFILSKQICILTSIFTRCSACSVVEVESKGFVNGLTGQVCDHCAQFWTLILTADQKNARCFLRCVGLGKFSRGISTLLILLMY